MKNILITIVILFTINICNAQDYKFGKVSKEELEEKFYPLDSSANTAILYRNRRTYYSYSDGWVLNTKVHERIKIYNKQGYDWATKKIKLYADSDEEKVSIKAVTYNLENNKIEKTKLKNSEFFFENINKYWSHKKFTMPNLKEGCVIEWEYTIRSPFIWRIDDMVFQDKIPIKNLVSEVEIPEFFVFKNQTKGHFPININKSTKHSSITINSKERSGGGRMGVTKTTFSQSKIDFISNTTKCIVNDVPAIIEEPYTNNIENYITSLKFEISAYRPKNGVPKIYNTSWEDVTKTINNSDNFGSQLDKKSYFKEDLLAATSLDSTLTEKIGRVFQFVKSKIKWNKYNSKYTQDGVRKAYKDGVGNVAEINLSLVAMLREVGVEANPILVSTRDHGIPIFPTSDGFNYVIAGIETENSVILLDATEQYSTPNVLPLRALNWQGRLIRENGSSTWVDLMPSKPAELMSLLSVSINEEGLIEGAEQTKYTNLKALNYRNTYLKIEDEEEVLTKLEEEKLGIEIFDYKINNKIEIGKPIIEVLKFSSEELTEVVGNKMYLNPLLFNSTTENPFKLEKREFPIDFGSPLLYNYRVSIRIPEGYSVESLPEKLAIGLPDNYGVYKFGTSINGNMISVYSSLQIKKAIYPAKYYAEIKGFYKMIVEKNVEQIVLNKI